MDRITEAKEYVKRWYLGEIVQAVEMHGESPLIEQCIQSAVAELLKDFINNPIPEGLMEGTASFNTWIDVAFRKSIHGMDFGFDTEQEDAVKNLAWNYWIEGIRKIQSAPQLKDRLFQCSRHWPTNKIA